MSSQGLLPTGESFSLTRNSDYLYNGRLRGSLAQSVEQRTFNPLVAGSNPARPTTKIQIGHATVFSKSLVGSSR
ncbi:MAG: hypothetical protein RLZZ613_902 [Pseudomonadota bacterium]|jgi:hypothetical protein